MVGLQESALRAAKPGRKPPVPPRFVQSSSTWRQSLKRCGRGLSPSGSSSFVAAPSLRDPAVPARPLVRTARVADRPRISWVVHRRFAGEFSCFRQISVGWSSVPGAGLHCDGFPLAHPLAAGTHPEKLRYLDGPLPADYAACTAAATPKPHPADGGAVL
jgi:hypothetical protein